MTESSLAVRQHALLATELGRCCLRAAFGAAVTCCAEAVGGLLHGCARQLGQRAPSAQARLPFTQGLAAGLQCEFDTIDQGVVGKGLLDKVEGAVLERLHRHWHITVSGEENHGKTAVDRT